ncbi:PEP-CTERM sorting domain-containing protein [Puniceicoccaceae bacterium K14]|nr:PEP-CTERM sorting domain-containing protein [Puniceicoccaceae bacterium K14]
MKKIFKIACLSILSALASVAARAQVGTIEFTFSGEYAYLPGPGLGSGVTGLFDFDITSSTLPADLSMPYVTELSFVDSLFADFGESTGGDIEINVGTIPAGSGFTGVFNPASLTDPEAFLDLLNNIGTDLGSSNFLYDFDTFDFTLIPDPEPLLAPNTLWVFGDENVTIDSLDSNKLWVNGFGGSGTITLSAVPEPSTIAGISIGVLVLGFLTYRRRKAAVKA